MKFKQNRKQIIILSFLKKAVVVGVFFAFTLSSAITHASQSNFQYGISVEQQSFPAEVSLVSGPWVLENWYQNHTTFLRKFDEPGREKQIPYLYLYSIAGMARQDWGLQDCNVGYDANKTLCKNGANYIRSHTNSIENNYINTANRIKESFGSNKQINLHFEPDFYQYSSSSQNQGGLTPSEAANLMNRLTTSVKNILPNAKLVLDISPWNSDLKSWSDPMKNFDYAGMVGKRFSASNTNVDGKTYSQISKAVSKKLIIDNSHGEGGYWLPFDREWVDPKLVNNRIEDGVMAVILPPSNNQDLVQASKIFSPSSPIKPTLPEPEEIIKVAQKVETKTNQAQQSLKNKQTKNPVKSKNIEQRTEIAVPKCSDIRIITQKTEAWNDGFNARILIRNISNRRITDWDANIDLDNDQQFSETWNLNQDQKLISPKFKWNQILEPNSQIEIGGLTVKTSGSQKTPFIECNTVSNN